MKKEQFRALVKEIICEVMSEFEEGSNSYPKGGMNDPKIDAKNQSKQNWANKKASIDKDFKNPNPSNKTPFFGGSGKDLDEMNTRPKTADGKDDNAKIDKKNASWKKWTDTKASIDKDFKNPNPSNKTPFFGGKDVDETVS